MLSDWPLDQARALPPGPGGPRRPRGLLAYDAGRGAGRLDRGAGRQRAAGGRVPRRHLHRARRPPGPRVAAPPGGRPAHRHPARCRPAPGLQRRAGARPRARVLGDGGLRAPRRRHPRPGQRLDDRRDGRRRGHGPAQPGFLTRGIEHRDTYYYRRAYADACRAVEVLGLHDTVDPSARGRGRCQPGWCPRAGSGRPRPRPGRRRPVRRAVPLRPPPGGRRGADRALPRAGPLPRGAPRPGRADLRHPRPLRRRRPGPAGERARALLGGDDGPDLPAHHRLRGVQRLRGTEGHRGLRVQRPRGRRGLPALPPAEPGSPRCWVRLSSTRGTATSRARASRGTGRGPPAPRRSCRPGAWSRRRRAAGRPGRRRGG